MDPDEVFYFWLIATRSWTAYIIFIRELKELKKELHCEIEIAN